jgi:hypothetical protein
MDTPDRSRDPSARVMPCALPALESEGSAGRVRCRATGGVARRKGTGGPDRRRRLRRAPRRGVVAPGPALRCPRLRSKLRGERLKRFSRGPSRRLGPYPSCFQRRPNTKRLGRTRRAGLSGGRDGRGRRQGPDGAPGSRHDRQGGEPRDTACEAGSAPHPAPLQDASESAPRGQDRAGIKQNRILSRNYSHNAHPCNSTEAGEYPTTRKPS